MTIDEPEAEILARLEGLSAEAILADAAAAIRAASPSPPRSASRTRSSRT